MSSAYPPSAEALILGPINLVWQVLLDSRAYPGWNTFIPEALGDPLLIGAPVRMRVRLGHQIVRATMKTVKLCPPEEVGGAEWVHQHAGWLARLGLVRSERYHRLSIARDGMATRYETHEIFSGLMKPLMPFRQIDAGFKQQALDLKTESERRVHERLEDNDW